MLQRDSIANPEKSGRASLAPINLRNTGRHTPTIILKDIPNVRRPADLRRA
jgi:hypothetical protein